MKLANSAMPPLAFLLVAAAPPAATQPVAVAPAPAPPAWSVQSDAAGGAVEIAATGKDGTTRFVGGCSNSGDPRGLVGAFSGYRGDGLRTDGQVEYVAVYARGEEWQDAFAVQLRYVAASQSWVFAQPLSPVFLASFSRGATLAVVNRKNEEIFLFDLTGSTAATRAMRTVCGLS